MERYGFRRQGEVDCWIGIGEGVCRSSVRTCPPGAAAAAAAVVAAIASRQKRVEEMLSSPRVGLLSLPLVSNASQSQRCDPKAQQNIAIATNAARK